MTEIPIYIIRGGSSRGVVVAAKDLPGCLRHDEIALALTGFDAVPVDGLGGGTPTTSKFVLIGNVDTTPDKVSIEYRVANLSPGTRIVDWSGTCGNMTSAVPVYALEEGHITKDDNRSIELINLSTGGRIMIDDLAPVEDGSWTMTTCYLDPAGAVYDTLLPTGAPVNHVSLHGREYSWSLIDVTHPYLFVRRSDVAAHDGPLTEDDLALIEELRAGVAVQTGRAETHADAAILSGAVPRVVLVSEGVGPADVAVTAISMGREIASVPVTSALCIAAAAGVGGSVVSDLLSRYSGYGPVNVVTGRFVVAATPTFGDYSQLLAAAVARSARVIMKGEARLHSPA